MHILLLNCSWNVLGSICAFSPAPTSSEELQRTHDWKRQRVTSSGKKKKKKSVLSEFNPVLFQVVRELFLVHFQPRVCSPAGALLWAVFTGSVLSLFTESTNYLGVGWQMSGKKRIGAFFSYLLCHKENISGTSSSIQLLMWTIKKEL